MSVERSSEGTVVLRGWHVTSGDRFDRIITNGIRPGKSGYYGPGIYAANIFAPKVVERYRADWFARYIASEVSRHRVAMLLEVEVQAEDIVYLSEAEALNEEADHYQYGEEVLIVEGGHRGEYAVGWDNKSMLYDVGQWKIAKGSKYEKAVRLVRAEELGP